MHISITKITKRTKAKKEGLYDEEYHTSAVHCQNDKDNLYEIIGSDGKVMSQETTRDFPIFMIHSFNISRIVTQYFHVNKKIKNRIIRKYGDIKFWGTSWVNDMEDLFATKTNFNEDISRWDVRNVTSMENTFSRCTKFNADLSGWNVSSVKNMEGTFLECKNFNADLSRWDVSSVENMSYMFSHCTNFTSDLSRWDVSSVTSMTGMFENCFNFNSDLSRWNISKVFHFDGMFLNSKNFHGDISAWNILEKNLDSNDIVQDTDIDDILKDCCGAHKKHLELGFQAYLSSEMANKLSKAQNIFENLKKAQNFENWGEFDNPNKFTSASFVYMNNNYEINKFLENYNQYVIFLQNGDNNYIDTKKVIPILADLQSFCGGLIMNGDEALEIGSDNVYKLLECLLYGKFAEIAKKTQNEE
mmetsp:Transcript_10851/g.17380  ORF Transcript_10851/g.17380 Transcript_10851/m.17380 type:complete len:416 (+) Transcript_10851:376-1623(+)